MGLTLQILTKTYCCNDNKDRKEDEKLIVQSVNSFHTEMND